MSEYAYPFDPTGTASDNLITDEVHTVNPPDTAYDYFIVIPFHAPFFRNNLKVMYYPEGRELIEGLDFALSYYFLDASHKTARQIYSAISLYDKTLSGYIHVTYQTLGGQWAINETKAAELLNDVKTNPRLTSWENIVELPDTFPVIDHEHHLEDMVGMTELNAVLENIHQTLVERNNTEYDYTHSAKQIEFFFERPSNDVWAKIGEATYDPLVADVDAEREAIRGNFLFSNASPTTDTAISLDSVSVTYTNAEWRINHRILAGTGQAEWGIVDDTANGVVSFYLHVKPNTSRVVITSLDRYDQITFNNTDFNTKFETVEPANWVGSVNIDPPDVSYLVDELETLFNGEKTKFNGGGA